MPAARPALFVMATRNNANEGAARATAEPEFTEQRCRVLYSTQCTVRSGEHIGAGVKLILEAP